MAQFTKEEKAQLLIHAKRLYVKNFDTATIADILRVSKTTIDRWVREHDFEKSRRSQIIALSAIRDSILESYANILEGKEPLIKPDEAAKYAKAFETFSNKKQVLSYMYEAYEILTDELQKEIQNAKTKSDKETALCDLKRFRVKTEKIINRLNKEVFGDDE